MRSSYLILALLLVLDVSSAVGAGRGELPFTMQRAQVPADLAREPHHEIAERGLRADTVWYGDYQIIGGEYYARSALNDEEAVRWTFDRGNGPFDPPPPLIHNGAGWTSKDLTANEFTFFRVIDNTLDLGEGVEAPIISGARSLWIGGDREQSDDLCWQCGAGYGNDWCQRVTSETLTYNGSGSVTLSFKYFQQSEPCWDGTQIFLRRPDTSELMLNPYPPNTCDNNLAFVGGFTDSIGRFDLPATYTRVIAEAEFEGAAAYTIVIEYIADVAWSDEDCQYATRWGPFGVDDITVVGGGENKTYSFETGLENWTPGLCDPVGEYSSVVDVNCYTILDPCACRLESNVIEMHQEACDAGVHPVGQWNWIESPIVDTGTTDVKTIFLEYDMYAELPLDNGVLYRPGWRYYPFTCEETGATIWSERVGQDDFWYVGADPVCYRERVGGTSLDIPGVPVPSTVRMVKAIIELLGDCEAFEIENCSGVTNFTPLYDNFVVGVTAGRFAPIIQADNGRTFQDAGSYLESDPTGSALFNVRVPGPANTTRDIYMDDLTKPERSGDSLIVVGPLPTSDPNTRWEARLWWRVAKRSPFNADKEGGAVSRYKTWKDRVADGKLIDRPHRPHFTFGWMDSNQAGFAIHRNRFISSFREDDDDFVSEGHPENEMIWDDCLYPGTRIEYFITSNFASTPNLLYYFPDTSGGGFLEFEILPGVRTANVPNCGGAGFNFCAFHPATLYIDAYDRGIAQLVVENALNTILNGADPCALEEGCRIPFDRNWDRYDYTDASTNYNVPFARGSIAWSNNGMTLNQILGYRTIVVNYGLFNAATEDLDYQLFEQWLISPLCGANLNRQAFIANGDKVGELMENPTWTTGHAQSFLNNILGAMLFCDAFNGISQDPDCSPTSSSYCVRWLPVGGGAFDAEIAVDAYGNYCPNVYGFNVYDQAGTGSGNRYYDAEDGSKTAAYAQITNEDLSTNGNYRSVLDGVSWHHMARRGSGPGEDYCPTDASEIIGACIGELGAAMKWGHGASGYAGIPKLIDVETLAACQGTWNLPSDADEPGSLMVNRLFQNEPNPFNPRTSIRFSLAQPEAVRLLVYDVNGRLVRTLVDGKRDAGLHVVDWDGTNDSGHRVGSGVFWTQMSAGSYVSNKKMVILK